jgi:HK97 family phage portal protein
MTAFFFWQTVMVHKLMWGNAYCYLERDQLDRVISILPLLPDRTRPIRKQGVLHYETEVDGKLYLLEAKEVLHFRGLSLDAINGCGLLKYAKESAGRSLAAGNFASRFFKQGARAGGLLYVPAGMTPEATTRAAEDFNKQYTKADNNFKVFAMRDGVKFERLTIAPNEGQLNETRESEVRDFARFINIPPSKLGLSDSVSYNSKSEDNQSYLDSSLNPHLIGICQELKFKLLTEEQRRAGYYFEHNTKALTQMDNLKQMQVFNIGARIGVYSPNEIRAWQNLPKRTDGKGDEYIIANNVVTYDEKGEAKIGVDGTETEKTDPKPAEETPKDTERAADAPVGLNGAQITAAVTVIDNLKNGNIGPTTATELLLALAIPAESVAKMVSETEKLPKDEPTQEPAPAVKVDDSDEGRAMRRRRAIFSFAHQARHKATKAHAFRQWLEGGLVSLRQESLKMGLSEDEFQKLQDQLSDLHRTTAPADLLNSVDQNVSAWENDALKSEVQK